MGLGNPLHIAFLLVIALLVFGAKRLPEMGRSLGSGMRGFKEAIGGETPSVALAVTGAHEPAPAAVAHEPVHAAVSHEPVPAAVAHEPAAVAVEHAAIVPDQRLAA